MTDSLTTANTDLLSTLKNDPDSIVSHKLKTPLSIISWNTELLLTDKYKKTLSDEHIKHLEDIRDAVKRLTDNLNALVSSV